ncbi:hypothetical protein BO70DRAFT_339810 [Aspergillus heteromorphus CBS 117.55]|uniref:Zn(2)-C6 fungal-type domain-containing protein n=1 Tax=Aspergillus heteromorphus CBS 117.55 TaxID=1448321 RepID=A0A317VRU6_9EURO|nr:uncharacterized protein BO70DRAFT_339810 [Aspergillus heteromorphus CBS 117.55]PWY77114.1 hypothetical protein BO70DRAFT_339810 [Aspergillus heteromorphus CBS 117.55]
MAQSFYPPEEEVSFEAHHKRDALSIPHSIHGDGHHDMVDPGTELDNKSRNSTRRRIQVACNRCRKRKIKCSGDTGDGQGCSNCRTSGNANCQFLRVNSSMLQTKNAGWSYATNAALPSSQRSGFYAPSMTTKIGGASAGNSSRFRVAPFPRASGYEMGSIDAHAYHRQSFGIDHAMSYEDEPSAYTTQSSAYMLSGAPQNVFTDYCGLPWNSKGWTPSVHVGRIPSGTVFSDSEAEHALTLPAFPYMITGHGSQAADAPPIVPTMSFPSPSAEGQGADRTLPNPSRNPAPMGLGGFATPEEAFSGLPHVQGYRTSNDWTQKNPTLKSLRPPMQQANGAYGHGSMGRGKPIPSHAHDMVFGLLPMTSAGVSSPLVSSSGPFTATLDAVDLGDEFRENGDGQPTRTYSHDHLSDYGSDTYVYSSSERRDKGPSKTDGSGSMLMNGLTYLRPEPGHASPPLVHSPAYRSLPEMHHTPVPPLNSSGEF